MSESETREPWRVGRYEFNSRLIIGSGKYESFEQNLECAEVSGAEMITVALRRVNFDAAKGPRLLDVISPKRAPRTKIQSEFRTCSASSGLGAIATSPT